jgi:hypothetical protein
VQFTLRFPHHRILQIRAPVASAFRTATEKSSQHGLEPQIPTSWLVSVFDSIRSRLWNIFLYMINKNLDSVETQLVRKRRRRVVVYSSSPSSSSSSSSSSSVPI